MAAPSPPEEASSALAGAHLLLRRVELGGSQLLGACFVRYYTFLDLLVVPTDAVHLPGTYDAVVQRVNDVENVSATKTHFSLVWLLVMEVRPEIEFYNFIKHVPSGDTLI